jgi:hypothetical protein
VSATLRRGNWRVLRIWEHDLSSSPLLVIRRIEISLNVVVPACGRPRDIVKSEK